MAEQKSQHMVSELLTAGFERNGPSATALSDPIADTPMVVTLDQLRPYDHDPRVKRNPAYEEIKASIRERGLDASPAITRRPGEEHFIVRNGGNTRLAILRELWAETKDERFFRISCLFRPWPERGEIVALTGHLAENELRGGLTFIERALGVEKAREFYEQESGKALSQSELARRLCADGYPVQQSHISRMHDAVRHLLPAIPNVLYGGLGRHQVERLAVMRKACERVWEGHAAARRVATGFDALFQDVLSQFDALPDDFSSQRVQDELIGQMADLLDVDYDTLSLDLNESQSRHRALTSEPSPPTLAPPEVSSPPDSSRSNVEPPDAASDLSDQTPSEQPSSRSIPQDSAPESGNAGQDDSERNSTGILTQGHVVPQAPTTERLQFQADGLYPISDVWHIEPSLDAPECLRAHIAQFAQEIAEDASLTDCVEPCDDGIGFTCFAPATGDPQALPTATRTALALLASLSGEGAAVVGLDQGLLSDELANLIHGQGDPARRLSDTALVKLFRLLRLTRRLLDLEAGSADRGS